MFFRVKRLLGDRHFRIGCLLLVVIIINLAGTVFSYTAVQAEVTPEPVLSPVIREEPPETELIVCIGGAVARPGVVRLPEGSRLYEALEAAGGALPEADLSRVNLAAELRDSDMIRIPSRENDSEGIEDRPADAGVIADGRIDINHASARELETLPGIGRQKAASVVAYREQHGGFSSIEEIMQVSGIKQAAFEKIKEKITVR